MLIPILFVVVVVTSMLLYASAYLNIAAANNAKRHQCEPVSKPIDALRDFLRRFYVVRGVSSRSQYFWSMLLLGLFGGVISVCGHFGVPYIDVVSMAFGVIFIVPLLTLAIRRWHDAGLSGWWSLWSLLLICAMVVLLVFIGLFDNIDAVMAENYGAFSWLSRVGYVGYLLPLVLVTLPSKYVDNKFRK